MGDIQLCEVSSNERYPVMRGVQSCEFSCYVRCPVIGGI